jgi:hypothetical protein
LTDCLASSVFIFIFSLGKESAGGAKPAVVPDVFREGKTLQQFVFVKGAVYPSLSFLPLVLAAAMGYNVLILEGFL